MAPNSPRIALLARHHPLACPVTSTGLIRTTTRIATGTPTADSARLVVWMAMLDICARLQSSRMTSDCQSVKLIELRNNISLPYRTSPHALVTSNNRGSLFLRRAALLYRRVRLVSVFLRCLLEILLSFRNVTQMSHIRHAGPPPIRLFFRCFAENEPANCNRNINIPCELVMLYLDTIQQRN
jgi:hypothetical protein